MASHGKMGGHSRRYSGAIAINPVSFVRITGKAIDWEREYDSITRRGDRPTEAITRRSAGCVPEGIAERIAARLLAEIQDELNWTARFEATTDEQWEAIAQSVRKEIAAGETTPLDEVFPPQSP
ncbi:MULTISPECIES: hypothetical protein [unclassified Roseofilum]|uniref:hypothetical protein n=2 Tax=Roseofilum TaxID=1233426 RepID=UPI00298E90D2|nr:MULTISPECIES: hypothetical protein [unclassified Roseofilum]